MPSCLSRVWAVLCRCCCRQPKNGGRARCRETSREVRGLMYLKGDKDLSETRGWGRKELRPIWESFQRQMRGLSGRGAAGRDDSPGWARCGSLMEGQSLTAIYTVIPFISEPFKDAGILSLPVHKTQLCKLPELNSRWQSQPGPSWKKTIQYTVLKMKREKAKKKETGKEEGSIGVSICLSRSRKENSC